MAFTCKLGIISIDSSNKKSIAYIDLNSYAKFFSDEDVKTSLYNVAFNRKIYSPNELIADVSITVTGEGTEETKTEKLAKIDNKALRDAFLDKEIILVATDTTKSRTQTFENLYVHQFIPLREQNKTLYVRLKAYSFDFQLTQKEFCHSYVAKRVFADILNKEVEVTDNNGKKTKVLWINTYLLTGKHKIILANNTKRQHMTYSGDKEPILPYMVQYNESFYDFMCRTANRCGEFFYFDEGRLSYGVNTDSETSITDPNNATSSSTISYDSEIKYSECSQSYGKKLDHVDNNYYTTDNDVSGDFDLKLGEDDWENNWTRDYKSKKSKALAQESWEQANGDKSASDGDLVEQAKEDDKITKSSNDTDLKYNFEIDEEEHHFKVFKKRFSSLKDYLGFKDKFFINAVANVLQQTTLYDIVKSLVNLTISTPKNAQKTANNLQMRWQEQVYDRFTDGKDYLPINKDLQEKDDAVTPFVAIEEGSAITNVKYQKIRKGELAASEQAMIFNLGTNYKKLKLGQKITVDDSVYVVVQVKIKPSGNTDKFIGIDNEYPEDFNNMSESQMQVIAVPVVKFNKDGNVDKDGTAEIFPPMYPKGHVRHADPQVAFVPTHGYMDPRSQGRLRICYPWDDKKNASPWLRVMVPSATSDGGCYAEVGAGDEVLVCYLGGNVERPYIGGFLRNKERTLQYKRGDMYMISKNGHGIGFDDPVDPSLFFEGLSPTLKTIKSFTQLIPNLPTYLGGGVDEEDSKSDATKNLLNLSGSTTIKDAYGVYSITMSTDQRKIDISSPFGKVGINAFTGITINAPNGDISIKGKNVSIEASNSVKIESGKYVKQGFMYTGLKDVKSAVGKFALDVVSDALLKDGIQIIDVEVLRSVVEIFFHPVSGTMQIKSHNYMLLESGTGSATIAPDRYKDNTAIKSEAIKKNDKARKLYVAYVGSINKINQKVNTIFQDLTLNLKAALRLRRTYMMCLTAAIKADAISDKEGLDPNELVKEIFNKKYEELSSANFIDSYTGGNEFLEKLKVKSTHYYMPEAKQLRIAAIGFVKRLRNLFLHLKGTAKADFYNDIVKDNDNNSTLFFDKLKLVCASEFESLNVNNAIPNASWKELTVTPEFLEEQKGYYKHLIFAAMFNALKDDAGYKATAAYNKDADNWVEFVRSFTFVSKPEGAVEKFTKELIKPWKTFKNELQERDVWDSTKHGQILFSENGDTTYYFDETGTMRQYVNGVFEDDPDGNYVNHSSVKQLLMDLR